MKSGKKNNLAKSLTASFSDFQKIKKRERVFILFIMLGCFILGLVVSTTYQALKSQVQSASTGKAKIQITSTPLLPTARPTLGK
jgi:hypothetical protein